MEVDYRFRETNILPSSVVIVQLYTNEGKDCDNNS